MPTSQQVGSFHDYNGLTLFFVVALEPHESKAELTMHCLFLVGIFLSTATFRVESERVSIKINAGSSTSTSSGNSYNYNTNPTPPQLYREPNAYCSPPGTSYTATSQQGEADATGSEQELDLTSNTSADPWKPLIDVCIAASAGEYRYELCLFKNITQQKPADPSFLVVLG